MKYIDELIKSKSDQTEITETSVCSMLAPTLKSLIETAMNAQKEACAAAIFELNLERDSDYDIVEKAILSAVVECESKELKWNH